jgi:TPR repeat protein
MRLGDFYREGVFGCSQDSERAAFYYHMAGEAGDARGMAWTGHSLVSGFGAVGTCKYVIQRISNTRFSSATR